MAWAGPTLSIVKIQQFASCFTALLWLVGIHAAAGFSRTHLRSAPANARAASARATRPREACESRPARMSILP